MEFKRILELARICEKELNAIMPITQTIRYEGFKAVKTYGQARRESHWYNSWLVRINVNMVNEEEVKNTIIHEILHTYPNCQCHTGEWKRRAQIVKNKLGYEITRLSRKELGETTRKPKYIIECQDCGTITKLYKKTWWLDKLDICSCGRCKSHNLKIKN